MAENNNPAPPFEQALSELEALVECLEKGEMTLEESLETFERGIELTRTCQRSLQAAEQKVRILAQKNNTAELEHFDKNE